MTSTDSATQTSNGKVRQQAITRPAPTPLSPVRPRRRRAVQGLGVAMVAVAALAAAWVVQSSGSTTSVVAVARDVSAGAVLQAQDLRPVDISVDPALETIGAQDMSALVGQRAVTNLMAGQTLTQSAVAETLTPQEGFALVGVTVTPAQMPSEPLTGGDKVLIIDTPVAQGEPPTQEPDSIQARVVSTAPVPDTGQTIINVTVADAEAASLAARVATGRIAVIVLPAAGGRN